MSGFKGGLAKDFFYFFYLSC